MTAGAGITITDAGAGSTVTVAAPQFGVTSADILTSACSTAAAYTNFTQNRLHYVPVWLPTGTVDRIGSEITGAGTDSHRWGIYQNVNGRPSGSALLDVAYSGSQGVILGTASLSVSAGIYWLAYVHQGTLHSCLNIVSTNAQGTAFSPLHFATPTESASVLFRRVAGFYDSQTVSGSLPSVGSLTSVMTAPVVVVRFA